jgi:hypothetical protein
MSAAQLAKEMEDVMDVGKMRSKVYRNFDNGNTRAAPNDIDALNAEQARVEGDGRKYKAAAVRERAKRGSNGMGDLWATAKKNGLVGAEKANWVRKQVQGGALKRAAPAA